MCVNTHARTHPEATSCALRTTHSPQTQAEGQQGDRVSIQACTQSCPPHSEQETHVHERPLNCPLLRFPTVGLGLGSTKRVEPLGWGRGGVGWVIHFCGIPGELRKRPGRTNPYCQRLGVWGGGGGFRPAET